LGMLTNSGVLVGNSSSGMIEASYFRIPVVNIGSRQKDRERGKNVIDIPNGTTNSIYHVIKKSLKKKKISKIKKSPYGNRNASRKIVQHLEKIKLNKNIIQKRIAY